MPKDKWKKIQWIYIMYIRKKLFYRLFSNFHRNRYFIPLLYATFVVALMIVVNHFWNVQLWIFCIVCYLKNASHLSLNGTASIPNSHLINFCVLYFCLDRPIYLLLLSFRFSSILIRMVTNCRWKKPFHDTFLVAKSWKSRVLGKYFLIEIRFHVDVFNDALDETIVQLLQNDFYLGIHWNRLLSLHEELSPWVFGELIHQIWNKLLWMITFLI